MEEKTVVIVGAGPSGLAASFCLSKLNIENIILEKEDSFGSLWKKRAYDRLQLHLPKHLCELPFLPHASDAPTYMSKDYFISYMDKYVTRFNINPIYNQAVVSCAHDQYSRKWVVQAQNTITGAMRIFIAKYIVIATGENSEPKIPKLPGLESFVGEVLHSQEYKNGSVFMGKQVLVVGCGNSGMEIGLDLAKHGAFTSIIVRNPFHITTKELIRKGITMLRFLPLKVVDMIVNILSAFSIGNLSMYGIHRPSNGPFLHKVLTGKTPVIDVGTVELIRNGDIKVVPGIRNVDNDSVHFDDGSVDRFDVILFATGYRSSTNQWLKDFKCIMTNEGLPKNPVPNHWKGSNGSYCIGFSRMGISGISKDAKVVADDICLSIKRERPYR